VCPAVITCAALTALVVSAVGVLRGVKVRSHACLDSRIVLNLFVEFLYMGSRCRYARFHRKSVDFFIF
jgi:choline-glycine betaine transporter